MIEIDDIAPGLLVLAAMLAVGHAIAARSSFYRGLLAAQATGRYGEIDGLRGFLASSVFIAHILGNYDWYHLHYVGWPRSVFYTLCGSAPVSLFFMVTGYLFWRRAAKAPGYMDIAPLMRSRLRRLVPLYFSALAAIVVIVGVETRWTLVVPPAAFAAALARWASFGIFGSPTLNGVAATAIDPPLWTLRYEWLFYLALPGLSFLATPRRLAALILAWAALSATRLISPLDYLVANFLVGMVVAQAAAAGPLPAVLRTRTAAALALLPLLGLGLATDGDFSVLQSLALAPLFATVAAGNDFFGALSSRAARCLGLMSYSIYVLHCVLLYVALELVDRVTAVGSLAPAAYWALNLPLAALLLGVTALTYRWIEHPFLAAPSPAAPPALPRRAPA